MPTQIQDSLLRIAAVKQVCAMSRSQIYFLESQGQFPKRVAIGPRSVAWRQSAVQAWIESRQPKAA